ncbi:hypothetical protein ACFLVL_00960 [Chloroflexota bacterium]
MENEKCMGCVICKSKCLIDAIALRRDIEDGKYLDIKYTRQVCG